MAASNRDLLAVAAGAIRLTSGVSFIVAPEQASRVWGSDPDDNPTASLLLRSMGYRDALVGAMLLRAGLSNHRTTAGWFIASAGADLADLIGGLANHDRLPDRSGSAVPSSASRSACSVPCGRASAPRARTDPNR